jgi:adenine-specific DNA-methyltransferase
MAIQTKNESEMSITIIPPGERLLERVEKFRQRANSEIEPSKRSSLGQFMTPGAVSQLVAGMLRAKYRHIRVLDAGAGVGSLTAALVERLLAQKARPTAITVTAYEIDHRLAGYLKQSLNLCRRFCSDQGIHFEFTIRESDFIEACAAEERSLFDDGDGNFNCVIMNPPYRKINSDSVTRRKLRKLGIETTNLYTAFMLLAARRLEPGGQFVSITPRSFCNGPYFRPFRRSFLRLIPIRRIHVFESRKDAFKEDAVLQENVILYGVRSSPVPKSVTVSSSSATGKIASRKVAPGLVVQPDDPDAVIHIPVGERGDDATAAMSKFGSTLDDLELVVSTGRVVDFRARRYLRAEPADDTVPLVFPAHLQNGHVVWPNGRTRKPNAILDSEETADLLIPSGFYVIVKRFSAKEERKRVVAALFDPREIDAPRVGFDNKTNYFHRFGKGIPENLAKGLTVYLNSTLVDEYFRVFSGHTQVNATDLRRLPYPSSEQLLRLSASCRIVADQTEIDAAVEGLAVSPL